MKNHLYIISSLLLLAGCSSRISEPPALDPEPAPSSGRLTLIRIEPEPAPTEVLVYLHGELAAVIGNESFVTLVLPEGTHTLTLDWEDSPLQFKEVIVLEPGRLPDKYLSLVRMFSMPEITKTTDGTDYTMVESVGFIELSPDIGKSVIKNLDPDFSFVDRAYKKPPN